MRRRVRLSLIELGVVGGRARSGVRGAGSKLRSFTDPPGSAIAKPSAACNCGVGGFVGCLTKIEAQRAQRRQLTAKLSGRQRFATRRESLRGAPDLVCRERKLAAGATDKGFLLFEPTSSAARVCETSRVGTWARLTALLSKRRLRS